MKEKEVSFNEIVEFFDIYKDRMRSFEYDSYLYQTKISFDFIHKEEVVKYWNDKGYFNFTNLTLKFGI